MSIYQVCLGLTHFNQKSSGIFLLFILRMEDCSSVGLAASYRELVIPSAKRDVWGFQSLYSNRSKGLLPSLPKAKSKRAPVASKRRRKVGAETLSRPLPHTILSWPRKGKEMILNQIWG